MYEIIALFTILNPCLFTTTTRQLCRVAFALLTMSGRGTMLNISRWTGQGGSYRTVQRFFNTVIPWATICWMFFRTHLLDCESNYILAGDEVVVPKSGKSTYGLSRFFSALYSKVIPGLSFLAVSLVSVNRRRSYPGLFSFNNFHFMRLTASLGFEAKYLVASAIAVYPANRNADIAVFRIAAITCGMTPHRTGEASSPNIVSRI